MQGDYAVFFLKPDGEPPQINGLHIQAKSIQLNTTYHFARIISIIIGIDEQQSTRSACRDGTTDQRQYWRQVPGVYILRRPG
jgi:hypothetical protein